MSLRKEHQNLDNIFLRNIRFNKGERVAIQGLTDLSIIPSLSEKLKEDSRIAIISKDRRGDSNISNYLKEFGREDLFTSLVWDLRRIKRLKDEQFNTIALIGIGDLEREPIPSLSSYFRLLKEGGRFMIVMEKSDRNDMFLGRLLYEAEMGEMIGLLEKVGFSKRFYLKRIITNFIEALIITALKTGINISFYFQ